MKNRDKLALPMGIGAVFIWALATAFMRGLTEELGVFTAGAIASGLGGGIVLLYKAKTVGLRGLKETPRAYWLACGIPFLAFALTVNISVGLAYTREEVVTTGLLRLIWPLLALIFTIPLHKRRVSKWFIASVSLSLIGIILGNYTEGLSPLILLRAFIDTWVPSLFALLSSISWALYSNYLGKYVKNPRDDHVGLLMMIDGGIKAILAVFLGETPQFAAGQFWGIFYMVAVNSFLANIFWVRAMGSGYRHAAILFANLTPLIATVAVALTLGVSLTLPLILGSVLVAGGTLWSKFCFLPDEGEEKKKKFE